MTFSLILACIWAIVANFLAILPSRDNYWARAYGLIAFGVPIVGYVTLENGPWWGLGVLIGGISMLRWPVIYLGRWLRIKLHVSGK